MACNVQPLRWPDSWFDGSAQQHACEERPAGYVPNHQVMVLLCVLHSGCRGPERPDRRSVWCPLPGAPCLSQGRTPRRPPLTPPGAPRADARPLRWSPSRPLAAPPAGCLRLSRPGAPPGPGGGQRRRARPRLTMTGCAG